MTRWLCLFLFLAPGNGSAADAEQKRPNIIVIFTDDHGYCDLSCQGILDDIRTPNIDKLAVGGVRMTSGYVTAPQCVPSRAGLLTGRYQNRFGVESNGQPLAGFNAQSTIAERLKGQGYATGMIGKWHLGPASEIVNHGFDDVFYQGGSWTNYDLDGNDVQPGTKFDGLYHLDAKSAAAKAFIKRHHQQPFFLYLAYRAPHVPLDATKEYLQRFASQMPHRRRQALAMLAAVDDGVGGVIDSLRRYGIEENTLVFFIGDNGAPLKIHKIDAPGGGPGWDGSLNDPLNGEKGMLAEGGIRVPFVVYWKGTIPGGQVFDHPVISLDVAATALALAGLPADPQLDGANLVPYLTGRMQTAPHETLYWRWIAQAAIREGKWKFLQGGARQYLFDLEADREEKNNLLSEHPEAAQRLSEKLARWASELDPPGLETRSMSQTWEQYFDYYLDGKPVPPSARSAGKADRARSVQGWIARNATMEIDGGLLKVRAEHGKGPFIAAAGIRVPAGATAVVRMQTSSGGKAGISWREQGQREFPPHQVIRFDSESSSQLQEHRVKIGGTKDIIHIRLLLPSRGADIESIELTSEAGQVVKKWRFER